MGKTKRTCQERKPDVFFSDQKMTTGKAAARLNKTKQKLKRFEATGAVTNKAGEIHLKTPEREENLAMEVTVENHS